MADLNMGLVTEITEEERSGGYLPVQGEEHYNEECLWERSENERLVEFNGRRNVRGWVLTRYCECSRHLQQQQEVHFNIGCKWHRVKDTAFNDYGQQKVYIYRKCVCHPQY